MLGAGASKEAEIPMSAEMIDEIEALLANDSDWKPFRELYHHVKSSIHFSAGLKGVFGWSVPFNIETLVNTLYELERNEEHPDSTRSLRHGIRGSLVLRRRIFQT